MLKRFKNGLLLFGLLSLAACVSVANMADGLGQAMLSQDAAGDSFSIQDLRCLIRIGQQNQMERPVAMDPAGFYGSHITAGSSADNGNIICFHCPPPN